MEKKTHIDKLRNPNYLGGWDLLDENGNTTLKSVTIKEVKNDNVFNQKSQAEEPVLTVYFEECKPIILNATNRKMLKKVTKTDYIEDMVGMKITLTTKKIRAFGEMHDAIRITDQKVATVSDIKPLQILSESKTIAELAVNWDKLTPTEKSLPTVLAKKDALKTELK